MTAVLQIVVLGDPVGKGRPRMAVINGHARAYTPAPTASWEGRAASIARAAWLGGRVTRAPHEGPVAVTIRAVASRPGRLLRRKDPDGRLWRTAKPDLDNCCKAVLDALVRAGVLRDDVLVVELVAQSLYAARDEGPCVEVYVREARVLEEPAPVWPTQGALFAQGAPA